MPAQTKWRALIAACGLLVTVLASRVFYFQELFFAFLFFAVAYLILVLLVGLALGLWFLYARAVVYLALHVTNQGRNAMPLLRIFVLCLAPTVTKTADAVSGAQQVLLYPFRGLLLGWLESFRLDAAQFREDAERAVRHMRFRVKQS
ncbi:MAG TPA: hypothetical protein VFN26_06710 [Candidatus Acidoferrum sp.]|nr:hypothetical protein [Candidatus Acidoferrum sp.]